MPTEPASPKPTIESVRVERAGDVAGGEAGAGPCGACGVIDVEAVDVAEVDHEAAVAGPLAVGAVAAAADGDLKVGGAGEIEHGRDVGGVGNANDGRGAGVVIAKWHDAHGVVVGMGGRDDAAAKGRRRASRSDLQGESACPFGNSVWEVVCGAGL